MDPFTMAMIAGAAMSVGGAAGQYFNDDNIGSPTYPDINLERDNPQMWGQIMKNRQAIEGAKRALESRRQGMNDMEKRRVAESTDQLANQQSHLGLLGSSVGANAQGALASRLQADIAERAFQEEFQRQQYVDSLEARESQMYQSGLGQAMQAKMGQYQDAQGEIEAKNKFYSGIMGGGMNMMGAGIGGQMGRPQATNSISQGTQSMSSPSYDNSMPFWQRPGMSPPPQQFNASMAGPGASYGGSPYGMYGRQA